MNIPNVAFSGAQTIINIEDSHALLRGALIDCASLVIDLTAVTEADLAFAQLIVATRKSAAVTGTVLRWLVAADSPVSAALARAGLEAFTDLNDVTTGGDHP